MGDLFDINAPSNSIFLDDSRRGEGVVVITSTAERKVQGRVMIEARNPLVEQMVTIVDGERTFLPREAQQFTIRVEVPSYLPGGEYHFRVAVLDVDAPDETFQQGAEILFNAPFPAKLGSMIAAVIGMVILLLVVIGGLVALIFILTQPPAATGIDSQIAFTTVQNGQQVLMLYDLRQDPKTLLEIEPLNATSNDNAPAWSPDGRRLAFISNRGLARTETGTQPTWSLYLYNTADSQIRRIDEDIINVVSFAWSPDGERIVYLRRNAPDSYDLIQIEANGDAPLRLYETTNMLYSLAYYPDGRGLTFVENSLMQYYLFSSNAVAPLMPEEFQRASFGYPLEMAWSEGGDVLAIASLTDPTDRRVVSLYRIDVVETSDTVLDPQEETIIRLTFGHNDRLPLWTLDGERLLFVSTTRDNTSYLPQVYGILARPESEIEKIDMPAALAIFQPALQPNVGAELAPTATPTLTNTPTVTPSPTATATAAP